MEEEVRSNVRISDKTLTAYSEIKLADEIAIVSKQVAQLIKEVKKVQKSFDVLVEQAVRIGADMPKVKEEQEWIEPNEIN